MQSHRFPNLGFTSNSFLNKAFNSFTQIKRTPLAVPPDVIKYKSTDRSLPEQDAIKTANSSASSDTPYTQHTPHLPTHRTSTS